MQKEPHWHSLNMLPVYLEISQGQLKETLVQCKNLQQAKDKPHVLDRALLNRMQESYTSQNRDLWVFIEQCKKWRDQNPTAPELKDIAEVETNTKRLEEANNEILAMVASFEGKAIDDVLAKDDFEMGVEWLLGQMGDK